MSIKITGNDLKVGNVIELRASLWVVTKTQHVKPGKGGAYVQAELKEINKNTKRNERFRSSETITRASLRQQEHEFIYKNGDDYVFMNKENYEQIELNELFIGNAKEFLTEGMTVVIESHENNPLSIKLPEKIVLKVIETEPYTKGQTVSSSFKPAILEGNIKTNVPPFVCVDDMVEIYTENKGYVRRRD